MSNQYNKDFVIVVLTQSQPIPIPYLPKYYQSNNTTLNNNNIHHNSIRQSPRLSSSFLSNSISSSIK